MSEPTNFHALVVEKLGSRCVACGFDRDSRILSLYVKGGGGAEARKGQSRERFYLQALGRPEGFELVCKNCLYSRMLDAKARTQVNTEEVCEGRRGLLVWQPVVGTTNAVALARQLWIEDEVEKGWEAVIVMPDNVGTGEDVVPVYVYGEKNPFGVGWKAVKDRWPKAGERPMETVRFLEGV